MKREQAEASTKILGKETHVLPMEEAEKCTYVACGRWAVVGGIIPGSFKDTCKLCGAEISVSPDSPKKPTRICVSCAMAMNGGEADRFVSSHTEERAKDLLHAHERRN